MKRTAIWLGICALVSLSCPLRAADQARLPYALIYQIQQKEASLALTYTNLQVFLRMKSSLPEVKVADLKVYIDSKDGPIPVALDPNGKFSVPMRDSLLAENPMILVNQPKGTMEFGWYVGLLVSETPTNGIRYSAMMRPLKDLEAIRSQMIPGISALSIHGLKLIYPRDKDGTIVIHAKAGDRTFKTDSAHELVIPWEQPLLEEDPPISLSSPPDKVDVANEE
jgi:hypothetical protein